MTETSRMYFAGGTCATCGKPVPGGGHGDGCTGLVPGSEYRLDGGPLFDPGHLRAGGAGGSTFVDPDLVAEWQRMDEEGLTP